MFQKKWWKLKVFFGKRFSGHEGGIFSGLDILVLSIIENYDGISGYDLVRIINKKFNKLWHASPGTIYPLLTRLAKKSFIEMEVEAGVIHLLTVILLCIPGINGAIYVEKARIPPSLLGGWMASGGLGAAVTRWFFRASGTFAWRCPAACCGVLHCVTSGRWR